MLAGGVESMSRVPMFSDRAAWCFDREVSERTQYLHMGVAADLVATLEGFEREALEALALQSHARSARAQREGRFAGTLTAKARTIVDCRFATEGALSIELRGARVWDGRDDYGDLVGPGLYLYQVQVAADNVTERHTGVVNVAY